MLFIVCVCYIVHIEFGYMLLLSARFRVTAIIVTRGIPKKHCAQVYVIDRTQRISQYVYACVPFYSVSFLMYLKLQRGASEFFDCFDWHFEA